MRERSRIRDVGCGCALHHDPLGKGDVRANQGRHPRNLKTPLASRHYLSDNASAATDRHWLQERKTIAMPDHLSPLDVRINALRKIQEQIATIRSALGDLPAAYHQDVADELRDVANSLDAPPAPLAVRPVGTGRRVVGAVSSSEGPSIRDRMLKFFLDRDNKPATIADIAKGLGVDDSGVGTILYRRNKAGEFQRAGKEGTTAAPATLWNLTEATLKKLQARAAMLFPKEMEE